MPWKAAGLLAILALYSPAAGENISVPDCSVRLHRPEEQNREYEHKAVYLLPQVWAAGMHLGPVLETLSAKCQAGIYKAILYLNEKHNATSLLLEGLTGSLTHEDVRREVKMLEKIKSMACPECSTEFVEAYALRKLGRMPGRLAEQTLTDRLETRGAENMEWLQEQKDIYFRNLTKMPGTRDQGEMGDVWFRRAQYAAQKTIEALQSHEAVMLVYNRDLAGRIKDNLKSVTVYVVQPHSCQSD